MSPIPGSHPILAALAREIALISAPGVRVITEGVSYDFGHCNKVEGSVIGKDGFIRRVTIESLRAEDPIQWPSEITCDFRVIQPAAQHRADEQVKPTAVAAKARPPWQRPGWED